MDALSKIIPVITVGSRKAEMAYQLIHQLKPKLTPGTLPIFITDDLKHYFYALTAHFGSWTRQGPRQLWRVSTELLYGQLKKIQRRGRLHHVERTMLWGALADLRTRLKSVGLSGFIQTSFVERINLTLRHCVSFLARRTWGLAWSQDTLMAHVYWFRAYYHFARPHKGLRSRLVSPQPTPKGRLRKWRPRSPAMAAGLTDHLWSAQEILSYPVVPG
jgi:hypothetical protein